MKKKYIILLLAVVMALSLTLAACSDSKGEFEWDEFTGSTGNNSGAQNKVLDAVPSGKASEPSIQIHYRRNNPNDYKTWGFWLWTTSGSVGTENAEPYGWRMNYQDDFGGVALYSFSQLGLTSPEKLGFIAKTLTSDWNKDVDGDRFWDLAAEEKDENNYYHLYIIQGDSGMYKTAGSISFGMAAAFTSASQIAITTATPVKHVKIFEGETLLAESKTDNTVSIRYNFDKNSQPDLEQTYTVEVTFVEGDHVEKCSVNMTALMGTELFDNAYYYDGELGAI